MSKKSLVHFCLMLVCCSVFTYAQKSEQTNTSNEPVLIPLTEEQKKINPKDIIANQPDFSADEAYFSARAISGFSSGS